MAATLASASGPMQLSVFTTGSPSSSLRRAATGVRRMPSFTWPLGRPKWAARITLAPLPVRSLIVGRAARMRVSSVMAPESSSGTLKSTRTSTRLPRSSSALRLARDRFAMERLREGG